ncbi:MAG: stage III sporulation protein AF [Clostridia bacterium]|nr:stage III sporulation protein AF [Clostridia bacterium]
MEHLYSWALCVTICAVIACLTEMLTSDSKLEKTVRMVLGGFMLCAVIVPLIEAVNTFKEIEPETVPEYSSEENMKNAEINMLKKELMILLNTTLQKKGIEPLSLEISLDTDDSGNIGKISADIVLSSFDADKKLTTEETVQTELGMECNVQLSGH